MKGDRQGEADSAGSTGYVAAADFVVEGDYVAQAVRIVQAGQVLARHGLVTAFGHVSVRSGRLLVITPAADLADVRVDDLILFDVDAAELPPGAPAEAWAHLRVYAARPDVSWRSPGLSLRRRSRPQRLLR